MRRVLMICPYFAPSANVGAKRSIRFSRHLQKFNWEPLVFTVEGSAGDGIDRHLLDLLPKNLNIRRTYAGLLWPMMQEMEAAKAKARGRGDVAKPIKGRTRKLFEDFSNITYNWTPLDRLIPFFVGATQEAIRYAREERADAVYVSSGPFSGLVVGALVSRRLGLPLLLDLRDPWVLDPIFFPYKPKLLRSFEGWVEAQCIQQASRVLCNTHDATRLYQGHYTTQTEKFFALHNGFDRGLFLPVGDPQKSEAFRIVHFGNFIWRRNIKQLIEVLQRFPQVKVIVYGVFHTEDLALAEKLGVRSQLEERPQVPYVNSMQVLQEAEVLLLVQPGETKVQIPAKMFDYLCAGRPIIAMTSNPEIKQILQETNAGIAIPNQGEAELLHALETIISGKLGPSNPEKIDAFDAERQTQQLAAHLNSIVQE
jgi:glycosyltransferase involved in cell wall biosynthesis